jgi:ketosteroid isomerase-like protein
VKGATLLILLSMALALSGCARTAREVVGVSRGPSTGSDATLPTAFERVLREYEAGWRAKDAAALARLFAEDGFVLSSGSPPVRGRDNIEKHYAGAGGPLHLRALAWLRDGSLGYIIGEFDQQPTFSNPGKFTLTLVRQDDGRWLIFSDMDNGNTRQPRSTTN